MPHPGHFICSRDCKFFLNTYVGGYIVSTVGELWPDSQVRKITAECRKIQVNGMGDAWDADYMKKIGFEDIGFDRKYETMVFKAQRRIDEYKTCCPWQIATGTELDFAPANEPNEARANHLRLCEKWSKKK